MSWLEDLEDHPDTPARGLLWALLSGPLLVWSLGWGIALGLSSLWRERPRKRKPGGHARSWVERLDPRFRALVRVLWIPYLLAMLFLMAWVFL